MDSKWLPLATASILGQALIKQKCKLLKLLITHFDCLLRDSAAPAAVCGGGGLLEATGKKTGTCGNGAPLQLLALGDSIIAGVGTLMPSVQSY